VKAVGAVRIGDHANLADGETIVIGDKTYEWDDNATVTPGNVGVTIGADAAGDIVNLKAAINANKPSVPVSGEIDPKDTAVLRLTADAQGSAGNLAMSKTMADADNIISGAAMTGGENAGTQTVARGKYEVTALDILADNIVIDTALATPRFFQVDVRDTNGVEKAVTCKTSLSGSLLILDFDGATDPVATDEVFWDAWE
jgi:uncharacterized protein involved in outer membrane biogenesis